MNQSREFKIPINGVKLSPQRAPLSATSIKMAKSIDEDAETVEVGTDFELIEFQATDLSIPWASDPRKLHST